MGRHLSFFLCAITLAVSVNTLAEDAFAPVVQDKDHFVPKDPLEISNDGHWLIGLGGGVDALFFSDRSTSLVTNSFGNPADSFEVNDMTKVDGQFHALAGYSFVQDDSKKRINLALEYDHYANVAVDGTRVAFGNSSNPFNISSYTYNIHREALLAVLTADVSRWGDLMPYLQGGVGVSRNQFSNFSDSNTVSPINPFPNDTTYHISFVVGLGFDWLASKNIIVGIGYRFGYWGNVESGEVASANGGGVLPAPIRLSHALYSNQGLVSLMFLL